ncbi:MAG: adenine phosphoribosyltransferase [Spirochaetia bacterium]|nr:adenine phosphoribosyltransferase [Spirochaetia bacterium]MCF7946517.1 adenine phosphoribosyltransferase [Spirochaetia bacterium]
MEKKFNLDKAIRKVPDFPQKGVLFYDITSILANPQAFSYCIDEMERIYKDSGIDGVACIEARGFLFAAPLADRLKIPIVLMRKKGKLPGEVMEKTFSLEYGRDTIQMHRQDVEPGKNYLVLDDLIATGGTVKASIELLEEAGAHVLEVFCIIGLPFLNYESILKGYSVRTLLNYSSE